MLCVQKKKSPANAGLFRLGKLPLNHMAIGFTGIEPRAWEVCAVGAVGVGLGFQRDAGGCVQGNAGFGFHRLVEMLGKVELQSCLGREQFDRTAAFRIGQGGDLAQCTAITGQAEIMIKALCGVGLHV